MSDSTAFDSSGLTPIILCAGARGQAVIVGWVDKMPRPGEAVTLFNARMILLWDAACGGLFGLASDGPAGDTRLTTTVSETTETVWQETVSVSEQAMIKIQEWPSWKA